MHGKCGTVCGVSPWFARIDVSQATVAQRRVVQGICDLLDQLRPTKLDPTRQVIEPENGETWVKLRHNADPHLHIDLVLADGWVHFYGLMGHDESYSTRAEPSDAWEGETVEMLGDLLQAEYTFDRYDLAGKHWREVVRIGEPYNKDIHRGPMPFSLLPLQRWATHGETRRTSFECRGTRLDQRP